MKKSFVIALGLLAGLAQVAAQYAPAAGESGTTAMHRDSSAFVAWAAHCRLERGYIKISDTLLTYEGTNLPTLGTDTSALGYADGAVVSMGDGGKAVLSFEKPIFNGEGPDFAVFENGFPAQEEPFQYFLELGFVEVSSDSLHWVRFPASSETATSSQKAAFDQLDPVQIHNLAGKYQVFYGTPFDLEDLKDSTGIDPDRISYVRIVDAVGCIHPAYGSYDAQGKIINDPWPTPFNSGGFDLDAVGVIHAFNPELSSKEWTEPPSLILYPNPVQRDHSFTISLRGSTETGKPKMACIFNSYGAVVYVKSIQNEEDIVVTLPNICSSGLYYLSIGNATKKFIVVTD